MHFMLESYRISFKHLYEHGIKDANVVSISCCLLFCRLLKSGLDILNCVSSFLGSDLISRCSFSLRLLRFSIILSPWLHFDFSVTGSDVTDVHKRTFLAQTNVKLWCEEKKASPSKKILSFTKLIKVSGTVKLIIHNFMFLQGIITYQTETFLQVASVDETFHNTI